MLSPNRRIVDMPIAKIQVNKSGGYRIMHKFTRYRDKESWFYAEIGRFRTLEEAKAELDDLIEIRSADLYADSWSDLDES
jgi:hypothetical protein